MKRLRWEDPVERSSLPKRPYRDTVVVYAVMAVLIVVIAKLTGGDVARAAIVAGAVFVVATLWSFRTWRNRLRSSDEKERERKLL
jgi:Na+/melibiose symporter-like transporter